MADAAVADYSAYHEGPGENVLATLTQLADRQEVAEKEVWDLELKLKAAQERLAQIAERDIPQVMEELKENRIELPDCRVIEVSETIRTSISKANETEAFAFLVAQGEKRLIKRSYTVEFGMNDDKIADKFENDLKKRKQRLNVKTKRAVHPQSLAAYVRSALKDGVDIPIATFNVFRQKQTKIT